MASRGPSLLPLDKFPGAGTFFHCFKAYSLPPADNSVTILDGSWLENRCTVRGYDKEIFQDGTGLRGYGGDDGVRALYEVRGNIVIILESSVG